MLSHQLNNLCTDQVLTATAASEDFIDMLAAGDGWADLQVVVSSPVILDSAGDAAVLTIAIQSDTDAGFATALKTHLSVTILEAALIAGIIAKIPLPVGLQRYVRLYFTVATENFTTGTVDAHVGRIDHDNV